MKKKSFPTLFILVSCLTLLTVAIVVTALIVKEAYPKTYDLGNKKLNGLSLNHSGSAYYTLAGDPPLRFDLKDPNQAPEEIREQVLLGFNLMNETEVYAKEYTGDTLRCVNCHFDGGNTFGGKNGSISLLGVTSWYPAFSQREDRMIDLRERINNCFARSLNGRPLPVDGPLMDGLVHYFSWISQEVAELQHFPWRGLNYLESSHQPDVAQGAKKYQERCASCHQPDGAGLFKEQGALMIPPLWGNRAYNDGAGMNRPSMLSAFIYWNMPYQEPNLTVEEAIDIAQFIIEQKRPHFHD